MDNGIPIGQAWTNTMRTASVAGKELAVKVKTGEVSLNSLTASTESSNVAMIGLQAATMAANMALTMGISWLITKGIQGISYLVNWEKEHIKAAKEASETAKQESNANKEKSDSLNDIISKYKELKKVYDENKDKESENEIIDLQSKLNDLVNTHKYNIDLVNGSLEEQLNILNGISSTQEEITKNSAITAYSTAKDYQDKMHGVENESYDYKGKITLEEASILDENYMDSRMSNSVISDYFSAGRVTILNDYRLHIQGNTIEEKIANIKAAMSLLEENLDDYIESDLWQGLNSALDTYIKAGDDTLTATSNLVNILLTENYKQKDFVVNSVDSIQSLYYALQADLYSEKEIKSMFANGSITDSEISNYVQEYLSGIDEISDYYKKWLKEKTLAEMEAESKIRAIKENYVAKNNTLLNHWLETLSNEGIDLIYRIGIESDNTALWNLDRWKNELNYFQQQGESTSESISKFKSLISNTDEEGFSKYVDGYVEKLNSLREALSNINNSSLSNDDKYDLIGKFPELSPYINNTKDLKKAILEIINSSKQGINEKFLEQLKLLGGTSNIAGQSLVAFKSVIDEITKDTFSDFYFDIDKEIENFNNLYSGFKDSVSGKGLSATSIKSIEDIFSGLENYNSNSLFEKTYNGIHLNIQELSKLQNEYEKTKKKSLKDELNNLTNQYRKTKNELSALTEGTQKYNNKVTELNSIAERIDSVQKLASEYEGLTSSYNKWLQAQSSGEEYDMYKSAASALSDIEKSISQGWTNSNNVKSYLEFITGKDLANATSSQIQEAYSLIDKKYSSGLSIRDFFTFDEDGKIVSEGIYNFFDTVISELGEGYARIENGVYKFDFGKGKDVEVANALGINVEFLQSILRAAITSGFEVNLDSWINDYDQPTINVDLEIDETNIDNKIEEVTSKIRKGKLTYPELKECREELNFLLAKKSEFEQPSFMSLSMSDVDESLKNGLELLQEYQNSINELENLISLNADDEEIENAQVEVYKLAREIEKLDNDTKIKLGFSADDSIEIIKQKISQDKILINVEPNVSKENVTNSMVTAALLGIEKANNSDNNNQIDIKYETEDLSEKVETDITSAQKTANANPIAPHFNTNPMDDEINNYLSSVGNKSVSIDVHTNIDGNINPDRAYANGNAFAKGTTLGGEIGRELVVRNGQYFTIGENSAEFFDYHPGDIIFNHQQTEQLLGNGKITTGNKRGKAFSNGSGNNRIYTPINNTTSGGEIGGSSSSGSSSDIRDSEKYIDRVAIKIDRIERAIKSLDSVVSNTFKSWSDRNKSLVNEIDKVADEVGIQTAAASRYLDEANKQIDKYGLDPKWIESIQNGSISFAYLTNLDELYEGYQEYQKWYEKMLDCKEAAKELQKTLGELYKTAFDNIGKEYQKIFSDIEIKSNLLDELLTQRETQGYFVTANYYESLRQNELNNIQKLQQERQALLSSLYQANKSGYIKEGSEAWNEMIKEIDNVTLSIEKANTSVLKYNNSIREVEWNIFDKLQDEFNDIAKETDFLINLLNSNNLYSDNGQLSDDGTAAVGLHTVNYDVYMTQADKYAKEIDKLNKEIFKDSYNQDLINRRKELLKLQQDSIKAAQDEKDAIVDVVKQGIDIELNSLKDLINSYKEALDTQKDLHEYQNKIADQTKNIANLEKQLAAYENDNSEEAKAKIQQLKVDLDEANKNLQDTEYDKYVSDQKELLDNLYTDYEDLLNMRLDNVDVLISDMIDMVNDNSNDIIDAINKSASSVGYIVSDNFASFLENGISSNLNLVSAYKDKTFNYTAISEILSTISNNIQEMTSELGGKGFFFKKKTYNEDKSDLNLNNLFDRLAYNDIDDNSEYISEYYKLMGFDDVYGGTLEQQAKMVSWLKANGFSNGGYIADFQNVALRNNDNIVTFNTLKKGEAVLTPSQANQFSTLVNSLPQINSLVDTSKYLLEGVIGSNTINNHVDVHNSITIPIEHVDDYNDFVTKLQKDKQFEKMIQSMSIDLLDGGSSISKNKFIWK